MKKSVFRILAEAITMKGFRDGKIPLKRINCRKLSIDEIKSYIMEEFGKMKDSAKEKAEELEKGWGDTEIAKEIDWIKALDIKEFFSKK